MIGKYLRKRREAKRARLQAELAFIDQYRDPLPCHREPMAEKRAKILQELSKL